MDTRLFSSICPCAYITWDLELLHKLRYAISLATDIAPFLSQWNYLILCNPNTFRYDLFHFANMKGRLSGL